MVPSTGGRIPMYTMLLVGLAALAIGLTMQARPQMEGFQEAAMATEAAAATEIEATSDTPMAETPASAAIEIVSPPSVAGATLNATQSEMDQLKNKVAEIRTMLAPIVTNKPKQDLTLNGILDAEVLNTLDTLVDEVKFFDSKPATPELDIFLTNLNTFTTLREEQKAKIRSMVLTGHQIASALYYIYVTLPTMIVSSGVVLNPSDPTADPLVDPSVVKEMRGTILSLLSGVPKLSTKLDDATKRLLTMMEDFKEMNRINPEFLDSLLKTYNDFYRLCNLKLASYKKQITTQKIAVQSTFSDKTMQENKFLQRSGQNMSLNIQSSLDFIQTYLDTVAPIKMKVDAAAKEYPESPDLGMLKNTLDSNIQTMTLAKTSMSYAEKVMSPKKEGFVSMSNPYGAPTPNLFQARRFRLGKETLVTDVNATSLL